MHGRTTSAFDDLLRWARTLRGPALEDERVPYFSGDVAGILAAALALAPPQRRSEAPAAVCVLADRVQPGRRQPARHFLDVLAAR